MRALIPTGTRMDSNARGRVPLILAVARRTVTKIGKQYDTYSKTADAFGT